MKPLSAFLQFKKFSANGDRNQVAKKTKEKFTIPSLTIDRDRRIILSDVPAIGINNINY